MYDHISAINTNTDYFINIECKGPYALSIILPLVTFMYMYVGLKYTSSHQFSSTQGRNTLGCFWTSLQFFSMGYFMGMLILTTPANLIIWSQRQPSVPVHEYTNMHEASFPCIQHMRPPPPPPIKKKKKKKKHHPCICSWVAWRYQTIFDFVQKTANIWFVI